MTKTQMDSDLEVLAKDISWRKNEAKVQVGSYKTSWQTSADALQRLYDHILKDTNGDKEAESKFSPLQTLVYESISFSFWSTVSEKPNTRYHGTKDPDEFFMDYIEATDDEDWETLAFRIASSIGEHGDI